MTWKAHFDEPIRLDSGKMLRTLHDAANHIIALPLPHTKQQHWQTAIASLLAAAEKREALRMARIAMLRALENKAAAPSERLRAAAKRFTVLR
jgi:hypothetical protein